MSFFGTGFGGPDAFADGVEQVLNDHLNPNRHLSKRVEVPDVVGMTAADAQFALTQAGLKFELHQLQEHPPATMGVVRSQDLAAGAIVKRGWTVVLALWHPAA